MLCRIPGAEECGPLSLYSPAVLASSARFLLIVAAALLTALMHYRALKLGNRDLLKKNHRIISSAEDHLDPAGSGTAEIGAGRSGAWFPRRRAADDREACRLHMK